MFPAQSCQAAFKRFENIWFFIVTYFCCHKEILSGDAIKSLPDDLLAQAITIAGGGIKVVNTQFVGTSGCANPLAVIICFAGVICLNIIFYACRTASESNSADFTVGSSESCLKHKEYLLPGFPY